MYRNFVIKILFVEIILLAIYSIIVLQFKMYYMDKEYPMWYEVKERALNKSKETMDIVIIGDSRAKAGFKPNLLNDFGIKSINLSVGGATPVEGYYTLKRYLKNNPSPKNLVLSYTPAHLSDSDGYYFSRTVPFDFLEENEFQEVEKLAIKFNEKYILNQHKNYKDYKYPMIYGKHFIEGLKYFRWVDNKAILINSRKNKGYHWFGTDNNASGLNTETKYNIFSKSTLYEYYFQRILSLVIKYNIKTYFYNMPFNESSYKIVNKNYIQQFENYLNILKDKGSGKMELCNKVWYLSNDNFGDPSHLYNGVRFNTLQVASCVKKN